MLSPPELTARQIAPRDVPQISLPSLAKTLPLDAGQPYYTRPEAHIRTLAVCS